MLKQKFGAQEIARVRFVSSASETIKRISHQNCRYISGHVPVGLKQYMAGSIVTLTLFRHPISRIISAYNYYRSIRLPGFLQLDGSFEDFVNNYKYNRISYFIFGTPYIIH